MRLDIYLVDSKVVDSRTKAQNLIKNGLVSVNSKIIKKSSFSLESEDNVVVAEHKSYVSRSAKKLAYFLEELSLDISNAVALDIGSSTGGFTQVLLENHVKEVTCVDVGTNQLHPTIKNDSRVDTYESCDIRKFETAKSFNLIVSDVSFISLHHILADVQRLSLDKIILLFKPQFEVGKDVKRDKNGVVTDKKAISNAMQKFEEKTADMGWNLLVKSPSKITGKEGNLEYCYYFKK